MTFEKFLIYLALICGAIISLGAKFGLDQFAAGEYTRGLFYATVTVLTIAGWILPLSAKYRGVGLTAARLLILLFVLISLYAFLRENFLPSLPNFRP